GMGDAGYKIMAPKNSAVMFVEVIYRYEPLISDALFGEPIIRSKAAFMVRDLRDLSDASNPANPAPAAPSYTCDKYTI
ncbi:MAG TPA: histidine kinase, partial [Allosphingosinicella sp.]